MPSPGVDIEDSRPAARLGELSGYVLAAIAVVLPGIGPIVAAGPLAAGLGEAAGHVAGGLASALSGAGVDEARAAALQQAVEQGAVLLAVHTVPEQVSAILATLDRSGATASTPRTGASSHVARAIDQDRFTIGVFQDAAWARRGVEALLRDGFIADVDYHPRQRLTGSGRLIESTLGAPADRVDLKSLGPVLARGPLVAALQGARQRSRVVRPRGDDRPWRVSRPTTATFTKRSPGAAGILVAIRSEPRAADALAKLHAYGGGNAAIGAWTGRV